MRCSLEKPGHVETYPKREVEKVPEERHCMGQGCSAPALEHPMEQDCPPAWAMQTHDLPRVSFTCNEYMPAFDHQDLIANQSPNLSSVCHFFQLRP